MVTLCISICVSETDIIEERLKRQVRRRRIIIAIVITCIIVLAICVILGVYFGGTYSAEERAGPEIVKLFSCSTQLSTNFILLIKTKVGSAVAQW